MQRSGYYTLWGGLSGQADTYCMVNVFLQRHSKRGYESIWIYPVCCDYVWTGMHAAFYSGICIQIAGWCDEICFHQVSPTDEVQIVVFGVFWKAAWCHHVWTSFVDGWERFHGEQHFSRMCFWTLTVRMMFLEIVWNLFCLAWCICSTTTTSKLHFISTGFACQRFEHGWDGFCGERLFLDWRRFAEYWKDAFATYANACGSGGVYFRFASAGIWNMILWKWSACCMRSMVQACCTTE